MRDSPSLPKISKAGKAHRAIDLAVADADPLTALPTGRGEKCYSASWCWWPIATATSP
jgi:hypothetical protein